jgi:hypothetical protein
MDDEKFKINSIPIHVLRNSDASWSIEDNRKQPTLKENDARNQEDSMDKADEIGESFNETLGGRLTWPSLTPA